MKGTYIIFAISFLFTCQLTVRAQQARGEFGKNRVQYRQYNWQYISSENFDLYYYDGRKKMAIYTIQYLEGEFSKIIDFIGYVPSAKTKLFLYSSVADLQQSNIGLNHTQFDAGGETEFIKPYVELAYMGSMDEFKEQLIYRTTELMANEMMFGGNVKDMFKNAILLNMPEWCIPGVARYAAKGWGTLMDDYIRQLIYTKRIRRISQFTGEEATLVGQSIWNYIAEKYGKGNIARILNYTRLLRNVRKGISVMLGVSFRNLINDWYKYYVKMGDTVKDHYIFPTDSTRVSRGYHRSVIYTAAKISPDSKKLAYTKNDRGRFVIKIKSLEDDGEITVLSGGNRVIDQELDYNIPLIDWVDSNTLGVIGVKHGKYVFWFYDLLTKTKLSRKLHQFNNIRSLSFSGNGRLAVLSADRSGQNDLFLISTRKDRTKKLTNDLYDDIDASFMPNSQTIIFSSNRVVDTTNTVVKYIKDIPNNYNLYLYNLDTTINVVHKVTNTLGKNYSPQAYNSNIIYYLSDQRGIANIFRYDLSTGIYSQITYFNASIKTYDLDFQYRNLALIMRKKLQNDIFVIPNFDYTQQVFKLATRRIEVQQAKALEQKRKAKTSDKPLSIKELIAVRMQQLQDEKTIPKSTDSLSIREPIRQLPSDSTYLDEDVAESDKIINTEDYIFDDDVAQSNWSSEMFLQRYMKEREKNKIEGPFMYKPVFTYKNMVTNFVIDPLVGLGMRLEIQMNDILENYRFFGGVQASFDGESGNLYAEAQYLPYRIDYSVRAERKVILWRGTYNYQKYSWQKLEIGASLPLSVRWRFTVKPFLGYVNYIDKGLYHLPLPTPPVFLLGTQRFYTGAKMELVYDNSLTTGLNIIEGTRGKINFIQYESFDNKKLSFSHAFVDVRHYQKIYKQIILAMRGYMGTFFGNSPKKYSLGGMDNWVFSSTNMEGNANPLAQTEEFNYDLAFVEFATNIRGFSYATLYGNNVVLANIELRVPLIRAFSTSPISSNFLKNIQFTLFYDIGTSWNGSLSKLSDNLPIRLVPEKASGNPFRVEVEDFLNPWIYSYGFGFRAKLLGFYTRFDVAWPVHNYQTGSSQLYVTLGLDF